MGTAAGRPATPETLCPLLNPTAGDGVAKLEKWLTKAIARVEDPDERWLLRTYVNWQPLRRFRRLPAGKQVTHGQANGVRIEVRYAVRLLEWLRLNGSSFAQCTQDHVDTWLSDGPALRSSVRAFLLWTSRRGHTRPLTAPRPFVSGVFDTRTLAATSASLSGTEGKPNERLDRGPPE